MENLKTLISFCIYLLKCWEKILREEKMANDCKDEMDLDFEKEKWKLFVQLFIFCSLFLLKQLPIYSYLEFIIFFCVNRVIFVYTLQCPILL